MKILKTNQLNQVQRQVVALQVYKDKIVRTELI